MFTVKATYRGETRKLPYSVNTFPSFEQLCNQLHRIFPVSQNCHFSRLIFSPNATQGGRILIGREVRSVDDYNKSIGPYKDRLWPQGLLRFSVYDETHHQIPIGTVGGPANNNPWSSTYNATGGIFTSVPSASIGSISASHASPPPINYSMSSTTCAMHVNGAEDREQETTSISACSTDSTKQEIQSLIMDFKEDLDRILEKNFGDGPPVTHSPPLPALSLSHSASNVRPSAPQISPICSVCTQNKTCSWFICGRCRIVGCFECSTKGLCCLGTMERHRWNYTPMPIVTPPWSMTQAPFYNHSQADSSTTSTAQTPRNEGDTTPTVPFVPPPQAISITPDDLPDRNTPLARLIIHRGVFCDICENTIEGVRHKCLDCPDYDLCTGCITSGGAERHSPFHEFFEITEPGRVIVHTLSDGPVNTCAQNTAQQMAAEPVSHSATCNLCDSRIQGDRYKCLECPDFDTCPSCFRITEVQHPLHSFARIRCQEDFIKRRYCDRTAHYATCNICARRIIGTRFKCMHPDCPDFDLCDVCEAHPIPLHPESHALLKMRTADAFIPVNCVNASLVNSGALGTEPRPAAVPDTSSHDNISCKNSNLPEGARSPFMWGCMQATSAPGEPDPQMPSIKALLSPRLDEISPSITRASPRAGTLSVSTLSPKPDKGSPSAVITQDRESEEVKKFQYQPESPSVFDKEIKAPGDQEPDRTLSGPTWPGPANDLAHLMQLVSLEREIPPALAHSQISPVTSPLTGREALLTRPLEEQISSADMQQKPSHPVTLAHSTLSMLLNGPRSPSSVQTSSFATPLLEEPRAHSQERDSVGEEPELRRHSIVKESTREQSALSVEKDERRDEIHYSATFIEDVTVPDGQIFPPGAEFMKCWRVLNDSSYDWPEATELVYVAGEKLGVEKGSAVHVGQVKAGTEVDLWTGELKAPDVAGRYVSYWRLRDGEGRLFGGSIWIDVVVADALADESDRSIASSLVVMPQAASERSELSVRGEGTAASTMATLSVPSSSTDGIGSDAGSDISLVSTPSDAAWEDVASSVGDRQSQVNDYVLLYDDRSSEDE